MTVAVAQVGQPTHRFEHASWNAGCAIARCAPEPHVIASIGSAADHRLEGAAIGFGVFASIGGIVTSELCNSSDSASGCTASTIGGAALSGVLGGFVGLLVGGDIKKS